MVIKFATFSKRENSTAVYAGTWTDKTCYLKESCSIISPVIELAKDSSILAFNYAYIADFGRYYFVSDIVCDGEAMNVYLRCDVLATYKSTIGASSEYILRSASDYNGDVIDNLYPVITNTDIGEMDSSGGGTPSDPDTGTFNSGDITYIVGIINNSAGNKLGAVKYYALNDTERDDLMGFLLGNEVVADMETVLTNAAGVLSQYTTEIQNGIVRSMMNPTDYIVESYAIPYSIPLGASETIKIGWWDTPYTGSPINAGDFTYLINSGTLSLDPHPQSSARGHYLSSSPYTRYWLDLGVFGIVPIDSLQAINQTSVSYIIHGDPFGNVICTLTYGNGERFNRLSANVKCNFPIAQVSVDALGGAKTLLTSFVPMSKPNEIESSGNITNSIVSGASGIISGISSMLPMVNTSGSCGTFCNVFKSFRSYGEFHIVADDDNTHRGRPLCEVRTINTLSGYILVSDADISISGTKEENEQIKRYMNTGFYYE